MRKLQTKTNLHQNCLFLKLQEEREPSVKMKCPSGLSLAYLSLSADGGREESLLAGLGSSHCSPLTGRGEGGGGLAGLG